jgi:hypothetical protein
MAARSEAHAAPVRCSPAANRAEERQRPGIAGPSTVARGGVEPPTFRFSVGRSYQLSYLAVTAVMAARRA